MKQAQHNRMQGVAFTLSPEREQAFWTLADRLGLDVTTASAATLVKLTVERGRGLADCAEGFGAATELAWALKQGRSVQFLRRTAGAGQQNESGRGMGAPSGAPQDVAAGVV